MQTTMDCSPISSIISSGIKSKDGTIYSGCINGFIAFKPESFTENTYFPPVAITDFLLFNKSADIGTKDSPLSGKRDLYSGNKPEV